MQVQRDRCPNCNRAFYFRVDDSADCWLLACSHCHVGYNLMAVQVSEEFLGNLLTSGSTILFFRHLGIAKKLFGYLRSAAIEFRFAPPTGPNALVFLVARTRSPFPLAVYFQNSYYQIRTFNRLQYSVSLSSIGALFLLGVGLSLIPVLIGTILALLCFWKLTALPRIKGETRTRLATEQSLFKHHYELHQARERVLQIKSTYQDDLNRRETLLQQMLQNPDLYPTQIDLIGRTIQCTQDYLNLCDRAIERYDSAIRATDIQIQTSKLSAELSPPLSASELEFELEQLEDQLASSIPPKLHDFD